jgi:hypothetical protein
MASGTSALAAVIGEVPRIRKAAAMLNAASPDFTCCQAFPEFFN